MKVLRFVDQASLVRLVVNVLWDFCYGLHAPKLSPAKHRTYLSASTEVHNSHALPCAWIVAYKDFPFETADR